MVAAHQRQLGAEGVVQPAAVVHPRQRIGPHFGEGHQIGALLANFVVGAGNLRGQLQRGLEDVFGFPAQLFPGGLLPLVAQPAYPLLESRQVGMVLGQALANRPSDLLQLQRHGLGPLQLAPRTNHDVVRRRPIPAADQVPHRRDEGQGHRDGVSEGSRSLWACGTPAICCSQSSSAQYRDRDPKPRMQTTPTTIMAASTKNHSLRAHAIHVMHDFPPEMAHGTSSTVCPPHAALIPHLSLGHK